MPLELWLGFAAASAILLVIPGPTILSLYLPYLGIKLLRSGVSIDAEGASAVTASRWRLFANTYLVTALNPKGIVFFVAFLPQFIDPASPVASQLWILSITFVVMASINAALYAVFAGSARRSLTTPRAQRRFNLAGGTLLSAAGVWALLARRRLESRPVQHLQPGHAAKVLRVGRHERQCGAAGMGGDHLVHVSDGLALRLQVGADVRVVRRRLVRPGEAADTA